MFNKNESIEPTEKKPGKEVEIKKISRIEPGKIFNMREVAKKLEKGEVIKEYILYGVIEKWAMQSQGISMAIEFKGQFEAIYNDLTYSSKKCLIPEPAQNKVLEMMESGKKTEIVAKIKAIKTTTLQGIEFIATIKVVVEFDPLLTIRSEALKHE